MTSNQTAKQLNMERQMTDEFNKMKEMIQAEKNKMREDLTNEMEKSMINKGYVLKESDVSFRCLKKSIGVCRG
jgi:radical SAM superfamily enzyme with C-terminal helix-hairpin-helix motif